MKYTLPLIAALQLAPLVALHAADTPKPNIIFLLALIAPHLAPGHGYENYSVLFSRTIPWEKKTAAAKKLNEGNAAGEGEAKGEGEATDQPAKKRKRKQGIHP